MLIQPVRKDSVAHAAPPSPSVQDLDGDAGAHEILGTNHLA